MSWMKCAALSALGFSVLVSVAHAADWLYWPDGSKAWDGSWGYHDDGSKAWDGSWGYHDDGSKAWDGSWCFTDSGSKAGEGSCSWGWGAGVRFTIIKPGGIASCTLAIASGAVSVPCR